MAGSIFLRFARRRLIAAGLLIASTILISLAGISHAQPAPARQNVVLIVADDMRYDGLMAMPALERMAQRGISFSRAYVTSPLCCPSRASILTGLYPRHHGVLANEPPMGGVGRFDDRSTVATWAQAAGVRTGLVGRYLNGYESLDIPPGWDFWFALWQSANYQGYRVTDQGVRRSYGETPDAYSTSVIGEQARNFLRADTARPFMLLVAPRAPHSPATPHPADAGAFRNRELPLPPSYNEDDVGDKPNRVRDLPPLSSKELAELEVFRRRQLATLLSLDRVVDGIAQTLRTDGRLDQTWIIFTSDNGVTVGEHRLGSGEKKACPYEECVHVPLIVIPPGGLDGPRVDDRLVANIDLAPTVAAIVGAEVGAPVDGQSFLPLVQDPAIAWREAVAFEQWSDTGRLEFVGVRTADRKYVRYENGEEELYDQAADPYELQNLALDGSREAEKARLAQLAGELLAGGSELPGE